MLRLADTSIRLYRKKNGKVSFRLRSYLMIETDVGFRLSAYLKDITCHLILASGRIVHFYDVSYSDEVICKYEKNTMVHDFWAKAVANMPVIKNGIGTLHVDYRISFTGHDGNYESIDVVVPLIRRESIFDRKFSRRKQPH